MKVHRGPHAYLWGSPGPAPKLYESDHEIKLSLVITATKHRLPIEDDPEDLKCRLTKLVARIYQSLEKALSLIFFVLKICFCPRFAGIQGRKVTENIFLRKKKLYQKFWIIQNMVLQAVICEIKQQSPPEGVIGHLLPQIDFPK